MSFAIRVISSLDKVFCRPTLGARPRKSLSAAGGETVSFQVAMKADDNYTVGLGAESVFGGAVELREAGLVPCLLPSMPADPFVLTHRPGLFPDPLVPLEDGALRLSRGNWHAVWVTVRVPRGMRPGTYPVVVRVRDRKTSYGPECRLDRKARMEIQVLPFDLPPQKLIATLWFYADCLYTYYRVPCWSEKHWSLIEKCFGNMAAHGVDMLLTPLWTVPLDTAVGAERPVAQLLDIEADGGGYSFDFTRLKRWIDTAKRAGIRYFEMSHAFTQWGAQATPKIMVRENGKLARRFGWDVPAGSGEYRDFLRQLMAVLIPFLGEQGLTPRNCYFHVSDEPGESQMASYEYASGLLRSLVGDYPVIDALSEVSFFRRGVCERPVPVINSLDSFMKEDIGQRWVYYCGNWADGVPNRQFGMPSVRNRVLGLLLFVYRLDGFLNWAYNFWYTQHSAKTDIDPWTTTDAGRAFCGGGSFVVYPGKNGPVDSIHYEVFAEALQDLRALRKLESLIGYDGTMEILQEGVERPLSMTCYPRDGEWLLDVRRRVNQRIADELGR